MFDFIVYEDTDSVVDTPIIVNNEKMFLSELFDISEHYEYKDDYNEKYVKRVDGKKTPSFNSKTKLIENKDIKYVMKHKVKKRMFRIKWNNLSIVITEDHSMVICRDDIIIDITPMDIQKGDKIIGIL